jgi:GDPmannose 4,6-dehydratase
MRSALICGISGQDGAYLAQLLLEKGYRVAGTSRDALTNSFANLTRLGIRDRVDCHSLATSDFRSVLQVLTATKPDEIYYLAGQSSVGLSFDQPIETMQSIADGSMTMLEALRFLESPSRFYNAASSEAFGNTDSPADELTPFRPRSPYGIAKATAFHLVSSYREAYGLHASSGILFNHESPLRPTRFVTAKIVSSAVRIANGSKEKLHLGNLDIQRDWGWAPEYVDAMWRILQQDQPGDYVIATGQTHSLKDFVDQVFKTVGLESADHVQSDATLLRPYDIPVSRGNPAKAAEKLGWRAQVDFQTLLQRLVEAEQQCHQTPR